jgi:hypothetical protein
LLLDQEVSVAEFLGFHPNRNDATLEISQEMFRNFLGILKFKFLIV